MKCFPSYGALGSVAPCQSTLVVCRQDWHSYPISPGSFCMGAILTTSSIVTLHRGQAILPRLFDRSDTKTSISSALDVRQRVMERVSCSFSAEMLL
jgi:hypothetical protein